MSRQERRHTNFFILRVSDQYASKTGFLVKPLSFFKLKDIGNKKISLVHLKERLKLYIKLYCRLFISCLVFKIFRLKKVSCSPSWIIEDMHVTSREGSR
jgi:hypothetical protein